MTLTKSAIDGDDPSHRRSNKSIGRGHRFKKLLCVILQLLTFVFLSGWGLHVVTTLVCNAVRDGNSQTFDYPLDGRVSADPIGPSTFHDIPPTSTIYDTASDVSANKTTALSIDFHNHVGGVGGYFSGGGRGGGGGDDGEGHGGRGALNTRHIHMNDNIFSSTNNNKL